jgi:hypothetical protein
MPKYGVTLPITGSVWVEVEASSRKEAIAKALEGDFSADDIEEWEVHEQTEEGNVSYGNCSRAYAEKIED